jgi:acyl-coenzyme A thioesterase PaaI-like protein
MNQATGGRFATDTQLTAAGGGVFTGALSDGWAIGAVPNGGYVMGVACRALSLALDLPHVASVTGHYLAPTEAGPVRIETEILRRGRRLSTATARLIQRGEERVRFTGVLTDLALNNGPDIDLAAAPALPAVEDCVPMAQLIPRPTAIHDQLVARLDPATATHWRDGDRNVPAEVRAWLGFSDGAAPDVFALPLFADALPPPVFRRVGFTGWVPTVELTVHVHRAPTPGLLRACFATRHVTGGLLHEDGKLWDSSGRLVALSRQLAVLTPPRAAG